jgi:peptidyl-prolyl cis-trans isomerase A (cyclophilin A)
MRHLTSATALLSLALLPACAGDREQAEEQADEPAATDCSGGTSNEVVLSTNMGDITVELFPEQAPITVENFLGYVESCFYDGTVFHRVMPGFMIQTGGFTADLAQKPTGPTILNEADNGLKNERGTLAMARRPDPNSASSQFFINLVDNAVLDHGVRDFGYAVFGRVTGGLEVVDAIAAVGTGMRMGMRDVPLETVVINSARRQ